MNHKEVREISSIPGFLGQASAANVVLRIKAHTNVNSNKVHPITGAVNQLVILPTSLGKGRGAHPTK
jgi:hypothetical protein